MRWLFEAELSIIVAAALGTLLRFGDPSRQPDRIIAWHIWSFCAVAAGTAGAFLLTLLGVRVPQWVFALMFGAEAAIAVWRFVLVNAGRRRTHRGRTTMDRWTKALVGAIMAGLAVVGTALVGDGHITATEWGLAITAVATTWGMVYSVPNKLDPPSQAGSQP